MTDALSKEQRKTVRAVVWETVSFLAGLVLFWLVVGYLATALFMPTDSTDGGRFDRSNMVIRTDALTGCQYLESGRGGLTPRLDFDGNQICEDRQGND